MREITPHLWFDREGGGLNFASPGVNGEVERVMALGAEVVAEAYEPGGGMVMCTFADPDGNYFQLTPPWPPWEPEST